MVTVTLASRQDVLKRILQNLEDHFKRISEKPQDERSPFLSPDDLERLGIEAFSVDMTEDGALQFNPCFFHPQPTEAIQKKREELFQRQFQLFPLSSHEEIRRELRPLRPFCPPDFDAILENQRQFWVDRDDVVERAKEEYDSERILFETWYNHAQNTHDDMEHQLCMFRRWPQKDLGFLDSITRYEPRDIFYGEGSCNEWVVHTLLEDGDRVSPMPHLMFSIASGAAADDAENSLTIQEVRAIVEVMIHRVPSGRSREYAIHPVLVLSYTGRKHGRIIQATFDGRSLTLQYSQLWSFQDPKTAPVELFVRYNLSRPVGLEKSTTICIR